MKNKVYKVTFTREAEKTLNKLDTPVYTAIQKKLHALATSQDNLDIKKLTGYANTTYRLRVGSYRVIYEIFHGELHILVVKVGPRKDIYE